MADMVDGGDLGSRDLSRFNYTEEYFMPIYLANQAYGKRRYKYYSLHYCCRRVSVSSAALARP